MYTHFTTIFLVYVGGNLPTHDTQGTHDMQKELIESWMYVQRSIVFSNSKGHGLSYSLPHPLLCFIPLLFVLFLDTIKISTCT